MASAPNCGASKPFSAPRVLVWAGLGQAYEQMGRLRLAQKAYTQARACAPTGGHWRASYGAAAERIKAELAARGEPPVEDPPGTPPASAAVAPLVSTDAGSDGHGGADNQ